MRFDPTAAPPAPFADAKARIAAAVDAHRDEILGVSHRIWERPEEAYEERFAATLVGDTLAGHGFVVERPAGSLETAVRATLHGGLGSAGPRIGVLAEYDALPGLGHGCGHNTMAASGVGAAIALAAVAADFAGEVVFLGCPAEERGSGKATMIEDGLFERLDAALMFHPCDRDHVDIEPIAAEDVDVVFTGVSAHASAHAFDGRNALDGLILLFNAVGLWRQELLPEARVHGIILEGGTAANIVPERAVGRFMIRSPEMPYLDLMRERFRDLAEGAALATGTHATAMFSGLSTTMRTNRPLADRWQANAVTYGVVDMGDDDSYGSTDMANVSWVCPAIHPDLSICPAGTPGHSILFRDAAVSEEGDDATLLAATLVAQTAYDVLRDDALRAAIRSAFEG